MKHKAVEQMIRIQFNIPDSAEVNVNCLMFDGNSYHFEVTWWTSETIYHQCNCKLPQLEEGTRDFSKSPY